MSVLVREAKTVARQWVIEKGSVIPGLYGAYVAGSANWLPDDAVLPPTSDLDINVISSGPNALSHRGKFVYRDLLLEVTPLSLERFQSPDLILGDYHLAGGFRTPSIISDPSGRLTELQTAVSCDYARREWVRRRCDHARHEVLIGLAALDEPGSFPDRVTSWLFATGRTTHILLVAGLSNPTVRRRYVAARELLAEYGQLAFYETLLELLGCAWLSRSRVEEHLAALTEVFDVVKEVIRTPFSFASDIDDVARPLAIDSSRELIECGYHREAMFWIAVTYSRCQQVLAVDAPRGMKDRFEPGYRCVLGDLGITSVGDLRERGDQVKRDLNRVWDVAEGIMAANTGIQA